MTTTATDFLREAERAGCRVLTDGARVGLKGPADAVARLRPDLGRLKPDLLRVLTPADPAPPHDAEPLAKTPPAPGLPPCENGRACDLDGRERYCLKFCKPAFLRDAQRPHPPEGWRVVDGGKARAAVGTSSGAVEVTLAEGRPAWRDEVGRWPEDFKTAWAELSESHTRAGRHPKASEWLAWDDLRQGAEEAARDDREKEAKR